MITVFIWRGLTHAWSIITITILFLKLKFSNKNSMLRSWWDKSLKNINLVPVFFNLRLDVLRGDLGLPLFPGRDLQYRFLSKIRPAFILKPSTFATTIKQPPFVVNYSGQLFRAYPEEYQIILNTGNGKSRMVILFNNYIIIDKFFF